ncbi:hypothetical protein PQQ86_21595 [Paraburkholderia sediminicola]|uniref:AMP-binding protein n=1 Tax=Paraburkholderia sediminicola TaxID=458836 RepID=UPI0038B989C4
MTNAQPSTLPDWLRHQAQHRPHAIALRHKQLGAWHALSWQDVATAVEQLAAGLAQHGFAAGDALLLVSHPREEALLLSLGRSAQPVSRMSRRLLARIVLATKVLRPESQSCSNRRDSR